MTELDNWQPEGNPIHPYDMYELINNLSPKNFLDLIDVFSSPAYMDEADYKRNKHKIGDIRTIDNVKYFVTCSVAPVTRVIA